jgi:hypothetical protein
MDLKAAPLFLVLGRPVGPEEALFQGADLSFAVRQMPQRANAPLHLYAFRDSRFDSIFVTCKGASLLGEQAAILAGEIGAPAADAGGDGGEPFDPLKTAIPRQEEQEIIAIIRDAKREGRELTEEERNMIYKKERKGRPSLLKDQAKVEQTAARLQHLCRLIVRDRKPYCPLNGMVVLIPWAATETDDDAQQTGTICQRDIALARQVFQLHYPILALVCDLEKAPGFRDFVERFPQERLKQRLGQRFPLVPDIPAAAVAEKIELGASWICQNLFPSWIYKFLRVESADNAKAAEVTRGNGQLVRLMCSLREAHKRLGQVLARAVVSDQDGPLLYGGCYVAGTGSDSDRDRAFLAGAFRKVIENQNYVSWTKEASARDAAYQGSVVMGYLGAIVGILAAIALIIISFRK